MRQRIMTNYDKLNRRVMDQYNKLTPVQKVLFIVGNIVLCILGILFLVYNEKIFGSLLPVAKKWRDIPAGWLILWVLIFVVSFPPLIGYSSLLTIAGFVYGFPNGYVFNLVFFKQSLLTFNQLVHSCNRNRSRKHSILYPLPVAPQEPSPPPRRKR